MHLREGIPDLDSFARRHIGPNDDQVAQMLRELGFDDLDELIDATIPKNIRLNRQLDRLEALLNFQTMVTDLTALDIANASLLDEATAAAEAIALCHAVIADRKTFFVADNCHPQTIEVVRTRAKPLGIEIKVEDFSRFKFDETVFGALVQYPATDGAI